MPTTHIEDFDHLLSLIKNKAKKKKISYLANVTIFTLPSEAGAFKPDREISFASGGDLN